MKNKMYLASAVLTEERLPSFTLFREMQVTPFKSFQSPYHFFFGQYSARFLLHTIVSLSVDIICYTQGKFSHPLQSSKFDNAQCI